MDSEVFEQNILKLKEAQELTRQDLPPTRRTLNDDISDMVVYERSPGQSPPNAPESNKFKMRETNLRDEENQKLKSKH